METVGCRRLVHRQSQAIRALGSRRQVQQHQTDKTLQTAGSKFMRWDNDLLRAGQEFSHAEQRTQTRTIVYAGLVAASYAVATIALAPISYGPIQLRIGSLLKPLALLSPIMGLGLAVGVGLANLTSPFGAWDFVAMPIVSYVAALVAYSLRRLPWLAMVVQAAMIAIGVAVFPLWLGGGIPIWPTVLWVFASEAALYVLGYGVIWRKWVQP